LKYALNAREVNAILMQRLVKVDGKVRTDSTFPSGLMDVISIEKTGENFRLIYDTKGRFTVHRITDEAAFPTWLRTMRERKFPPLSAVDHSVG
jgi:small subunit ribosomal protein S4e